MLILFAVNGGMLLSMGEQRDKATPELASASVDKLDRAFTEVYDELRRLARARLYDQPAGHTLQTTALVHEAFLKLRGSPVGKDRAHFLRLAAEAMRQILIDHARQKNRGKRGGGKIRREELADVEVLAVDSDSDTILALESAVCRLEIVSAVAAQIIKLRFFAGLSVEETAEATGFSVRTVNRHWRFARAWLYTAMGGDPRIVQSGDIQSESNGKRPAVGIERSDQKSQRAGSDPGR